MEHTRFTVFGLNPNDVAVLLVVLILSLPTALRWSKRLIWLIVPLETLLVALLVGTGSRGGVLALGCGLIFSLVMFYRQGRSLGWRSWMAVVLIVSLGLGAGLSVFPKGSRLGRVDLSPDASAGRRLQVWSTVPAMLTAAPMGWGYGQSAEAYEQWFEPVGVEVSFQHLLSSHLTWLVEVSWPLRWLYLFLWMGAIVLLLPSRRFGFPVWGLAVWTAFLVALWYNAAGKWWNWPLPVLWLMVALVARFQQKSFPRLRAWVSFALLAGIAVGIPFLFHALSQPKIPVKALDAGNIVLIGSGKPTVALLSPSKDVFGDFYGQEIRKNWSPASGTVVVIQKPDAQANCYLTDCRLYVVSGEDETAFSRWESILTPSFSAKLVLVNCRVQPDGWTKVFRRVVYCHGEFYGDPNYDDWKSLGANNPAVSIKDLLREETYVADWWPVVDEALSTYP